MPMQSVPFTHHPIKRYPSFDRDAERVAVAMDSILTTIQSSQMTNPRYSIIVYHYVMGQLRIQLTDLQKPDPDAPEGLGEIVKQLCTYHVNVALDLLAKLQASEDPIECVESMRTPWNSEGPDDVVRLDTTAADNPYRAKEQRRS
jgi:hypothetical protein